MESMSRCPCPGLYVMTSLTWCLFYMWWCPCFGVPVEVSMLWYPCRGRGVGVFVSILWCPCCGARNNLRWCPCNVNVVFCLFHVHISDFAFSMFTFPILPFPCSHFWFCLFHVHISDFVFSMFTFPILPFPFNSVFIDCLKENWNMKLSIECLCFQIGSQ